MPYTYHRRLWLKEWTSTVVTSTGLATADERGSIRRPMESFSKGSLQMPAPMTGSGLQG